MSTANKSAYIPGLDGLRAISIFMVLNSHAGGTNPLIGGETGFNFRLLSVIAGGAGVYFFFVISGFLITRLLLMEMNKSGTISLGKFYLRRFLRLGPALLAFLAVTGLCMYFGLIQQSYMGLLLGLTYTYNFAPKIFSAPELGHLWSLGVEEQFYFLWPLLLFFLSLRACVVISLLIVGLSAYLNVHPFDFTLDVNAPWIQALLQFANVNPANYAQYFTDGHLFKISQAFNVDRFAIPMIGRILVGCLFAIAMGKRPNWFNWSPLKIFLLGLVIYLFPLYAPLSMLHFYPIIQCVGSALVIVSVVQAPDSAGVKFLETPILSYIGKISYSLYLWHGLAIGTDIYVKHDWQRFPYGLVLSFALAIFSYEVIEKPFLRLKDRFR